jgi:hypothetical protein
MSGVEPELEPSPKGAAIRFVKGTYAGMNGWIDNSKKKKKKGSLYRSVIVDWQDDDDDDNTEEFQTKVRESSIRNAWTDNPQTLEEAAIMQHPDIEKAMIELAEKFASIGCNVKNENVMSLLNDELKLAKHSLKKLGNKARFRYVAFKSF